MLFKISWGYSTGNAIATTICKTQFINQVLGNDDFGYNKLKRFCMKMIRGPFILGIFAIAVIQVMALRVAWAL